MKAKNGIESLVLAGIQGIGTVVIYLWDYNWPQTMAVAQAIAFVMLVAIGILLMRLLWICISSYVIFIVTSLADTPAVYLARRMKEKMPEGK